MKYRNINKSIFAISLIAVLILLNIFNIALSATDKSNIRLTLAGTPDTTSKEVLAYETNITVLDVIASIDQSIANPIYEVNIPKYLEINKYTLVADSNGKLQNVEIIDKDTGLVLKDKNGISSDDYTKNRILRFTITPGTIGPTGFTVAISLNGRYILPSEKFDLYVDYFNGAIKIDTSDNFVINAKNITYSMVIDGGTGDLGNAELAKYSFYIQSGGNYPLSPFMSDAVVKVPLPAGAEFVSGDDGVQFVSAGGDGADYLLISKWLTSTSWRQWNKFTIKYPSAHAGDKFNGDAFVLTYNHGGRQVVTVPSPNGTIKGISNKIIGDSGLYTDIRAKSYTYKIGANGSPFLSLRMYNNLAVDLTNENYDITFPSDLKVRGLSIADVNLTNTIYSNITFTTNDGEVITKTAKVKNLNMTPDYLGLSNSQWITMVNINIPKIPAGYWLCNVYKSGQDCYKGFIFYGTTDNNITEGPKNIKIKQYNDQSPENNVVNIQAILKKDVNPPLSVNWSPKAYTVVAGQKVSVKEILCSTAYPYRNNAYHEIVNPTFYILIPNGFVVNPDDVYLDKKLLNKKPNITWNPGVIPADANFPKGAGILKIEFDGLSAEKSVTLRGVDDYLKIINDYAGIQFFLEALENTKIGPYPFKPFIYIDAQNSKLSQGWGVKSGNDKYDLNGNGNTSESFAFINLDAYDANYVTVTDPLKVNFRTTVNSDLTGEGNMVEFYPEDNGHYTLQIDNRLNKDATDLITYIYIPQTGDTNIIDLDNINYVQGWTTKLTSIHSEVSSETDNPEGVEIWYSTSNLAAGNKNELIGGTDEGYIKYTGGSIPENAKMVKLKIQRLPKLSSVTLKLGIAPKLNATNLHEKAYMLGEYKFTYEGKNTQSKTSLKTLKLLTYDVKGKAFMDLNANGACDSGEPRWENATIYARNENSGYVQSTTTDSEGKYKFSLPQGEYAIWAGLSERQRFTIQNSALEGSKIDRATGVYAFTIDGSTVKEEIENINIGIVDLGSIKISEDFTDRVTARNNWITTDEDNQMYNKYYIKKGDEVITRITLKDANNIGYETVTLSYDFNSDNNGEVKFESPQVVEIRNKNNLNQNIEYSVNVDETNNALIDVTINSMPSGCDIEVYIKYNASMMNSELTNKLLNNYVDISTTVDGTRYSLEDDAEDIVLENLLNQFLKINLSDIEVKLQ